MMLGWFHWWWDPVGLARGQVLGGVAGTVLGIVAIVLAWRVAKRQFKVMDEQTRLASRQKELAEQQNRIILNNLERRAHLALRLEPAETAEPEVLLFQLRLHNDGNRSVTGGVFWELYIPKRLINILNLEPAHRDGGDRVVMFAGEEHALIHGYDDRPIFPMRSKRLAVLSLNYDAMLNKKDLPDDESTIAWTATCEDGKFPLPENSIGAVTVRTRELYS